MKLLSIVQVRFFIIFIVTIVIGSALALLSYPCQAQLSTIDDFGAFGYGDAIRIAIWESWERANIHTFATNLSGEYVIDGEGYVVLPIFGKINVIGMTAERFAAVLREKLAPFTADPIIMIVPMIRVTLRGHFVRPGSYRVDPSNSLWDLIKEAGGPSPNCNLKKMQIRRSGKTIVKSLFESWERGWSLSEIGIQTGDIIYAPPRRGFGLRDFMAYFQFGVSLIWLYIYITRWR